MRFVRDDVEHPFHGSDGIAGEARDVEVHRARRAGGRLAKRLTHEVRNLLQRVDPAVELGHRRIQRIVRDFLVGITVLKRRHVPSRDRDHRRVAEVRILHARSEIRRAHRLRHADAGAPRHARETVRHVRHPFLRVSENALDAGVLHLGKCAPQDRVHEEYVGDTIGLEHLGDEPCARHFLRHRFSPV